MQTESARMNNASEAKFRIKAPNSLARAIKIIALDRASEKHLLQVAQKKWNGASFLSASSFGSLCGDNRFSNEWLTDLAGKTRDLVREIKGSDSVIMVGTAGHDLSCSALIGEVCSLNHVLTTGLIFGDRSRGGAQLARALTALRQHVIMLVATSDEGYLEDMLSWLKA
jgi:hypothetical protein